MDLYKEYQRRKDELQATLEKVKQAIPKDRIKEAFDLMDPFKEDSSMENILIQLKNRWTTNESYKNEDTIERQHYNPERNKIIKALLQQANSILLNLDKRKPPHTRIIYNEPTLEKLLEDKNKLKSIEWIEQVLKKSTSICRIIVQDGSETSYGIGYLMEDGYILTNYHVIPTKSLLSQTKVQFLFTNEDSNPVELDIEHSEWSGKEGFDFVRVKVQEPRKLKRHDIAPLSPRKSKLKKWDTLSIIQYSTEETINMALHHLVFDDSDSNHLHFKSDIPLGAMGAPIFNDNWEVVGIYLGGDQQGILIDTVIDELERLTAPSNFEDSTASSSEVGDKKLHFKPIHAYMCDRYEQVAFFKDKVVNKPLPKTNFYYLPGGEEQAHKELIERFRMILMGNDYGFTHVEEYLPKPIKTDLLGDAPLSIHSINRLLSSFFKKINIKPTAEYLNQLDLAAALRWEGSKLHKEFNLYSQKPKSWRDENPLHICFQIEIYEDAWDKTGTPELVRAFIQRLCKSPLSEDAPIFHFFFAVVYDEDNQEIPTDIKEALVGATYIKDVFSELGMVEYKFIKGWFNRYKDYFNQYKIRASRLRKEKFTAQEYAMEDFIDSVEEIINELNLETNANRNS